MYFKKILVLSPHADDGILGCGGTIARFLEEGSEIYYIVFSKCEKSVPATFPKDILISECQKAIQIVGMSTDKTEFLDYDVRNFPTHRQEILDDLIKLREKIKPDLILGPSASDTHQDHNCIYSESFRAFKKEASIWGYEHPWNNLSFSTDIFIRLESQHLEKKIGALECFQSQLDRNYVSKEYIKSLTYTRGSQICDIYAETFELTRLLL